jgi:hypothetical protein
MRRRTTKARSWAWCTSEETGVSFENGWVAGAYVVRHKGYTIAQCTDKWMADMILRAVQPSSVAEDK